MTLNVGASVDREDSKANGLRQWCNNVMNLQCQFTCWHEHECTWTGGVALDMARLVATFWSE